MSDKTWPTLELIVATYKHYDCMYITATTGGSHATNSYHYRGEAIDVGSGLTVTSAGRLEKAHLSRWQVMDGLGAYLYIYSRYITELIHTHNAKGTYPGGYYVKNGNRVGNSYYGATTVAAHKNHVHFAIASQATATKMLVVIEQQLLNLAHKTYASVPTVTVDGVNGPKTVAALKAFQRAKRLSQDGVLGFQTAAALRSIPGR